MNAQFNRANDRKTIADRTSKHLQMQAARAFATGNAAAALELDRQAEQNRARARADFFENGVKVFGELSPVSKKGTAAKLPADVAFRRVFKVKVN